MFLKLSLLIVLIIIDQGSKYLVEKKLSINQSIKIITDKIKITSVRNKGAALGIFEGQRSLFIIISFVVLTVFSYLLIKETQMISSLTYIFLISGTCGNLIDRIIRKEVIDFIDLTIFRYKLPIFNFADLFLAVGVILLIISDIL